MSLYIRAYDDYSYELIYTEGKFRKKRIHLLVNPGVNTKLQGTTKKAETEINVQSLTHIVSMETSIIKPNLIKSTTKLAEMTNKPIITNKESSEKFRHRGISISQLRILGFQEEIIDGLFIDPIYIEELGEEQNFPEQTTDSINVKSFGPKIIEFTKSVPRRLNPFKWKPVRKLNPINRGENYISGIDPSNPLAVYISFSQSDDILIPLDVRAMDHIDELIPNVTPKLILLPNVDVSETQGIKHSAKALLVFNNQNKKETAMIIPKTYNTDATHDIIYSAFECWVDINEIF